MILPTTTDFDFNANKGFTLGDFGKYVLCQGQTQVTRSATRHCRSTWSRPGFEQLAEDPGANVPTAIKDIVRSCNNPTFSTDGTNTLANNDPQPRACDQKGPTQCTTGTGGATNDRHSGRAPAAPAARVPAVRATPTAGPSVFRAPGRRRRQRPRRRRRSDGDRLHLRRGRPARATPAPRRGQPGRDRDSGRRVEPISATRSRASSWWSCGRCCSISLGWRRRSSPRPARTAAPGASGSGGRLMNRAAPDPRASRRGRCPDRVQRRACACWPGSRSWGSARCRWPRRRPGRPDHRQRRRPRRR